MTCSNGICFLSLFAVSICVVFCLQCLYGPHYYMYYDNVDNRRKKVILIAKMIVFLQLFSNDAVIVIRIMFLMLVLASIMSTKLY